MPSSTPAVSESHVQQQQDVALVLQSAVELHLAGAHDDARALYELIVGTLPTHADAQYGLAMLKAQTGQPAEALTHFEAALGVNPDNASYWVNYIGTLCECGHGQAAWIAVELAQKRGVDTPELNWLIMQMAAPTPVDVPPPAAAVSRPAQADVPPAPAPEAAALANADQLEHHATLLTQGKAVEALALAQALATAHPHDVRCLRALVSSLYQTDRYADVIEPATQVLVRQPGDVSTRAILASALCQAGKPEDAEPHARLVTDALPHEADGFRLLGSALQGRRQYDAAAQAYRRAAELAPESAITHLHLGFSLLDTGNVADALRSLHQSIALAPANGRHNSAILFRLTHSEAVDAATLLAEHRAFGTLHESGISVSPHTNVRDPWRPLRIGLVSGDLFNHAVSTYLAPVLTHLARDGGLSLHVYYNHDVEDDYTRYLREKATTWCNVATLDDASLAARIRADAIDIVIDLSGHTNRNRLIALARKPAPVQVTWLGYPGTTGLQAMDYYIADPYMAPPGPIDASYVEKIVRIPSAGPYLAPLNSPPVNALPALRNGHVTYGSFNRLNKLSADVIALWARILRADPKARMIVGAIECDADRQVVLDWFAAAGVDAARVSFRPRTITSVYLQQHHHVDICLDAFPYTGATTTINALWMGVPTVTLAGPRVPGRGSVGWLCHLGLDRFVTDTPDEFVRRTLELSADIDALRSLRATLRERCANTAAIGASSVSATLATALREMWKRWCAGQAPAPFTVEAPAQAESVPSALAA